MVVVSCSNQQTDREQIISMVFNNTIGNEEHFGVAPPIPALPPDFDVLNSFKTESEAKQELTSKEWQDYFNEQAVYEGRVKKWERRMKRLSRKIILAGQWKISDAFKEDIIENIGDSKIDIEFLELETDWDKSDIQNSSKYEIINKSDLHTLKLDSIHVGILSISEIGYNNEMNEAIISYDWLCGSVCGAGVIVLLRKMKYSWEIKEVITLWVS